MSNPSSSLQSLHQEQTLESDALLKVSPPLNLETPNQPDPPPKSDPGTAPPAAHNLDPEYYSPEEEELEEEGEEIDEGQELENPAVSSGMPLHIHPPITDPHESVSDVTPTSPSGDPSTRRGGYKRRKGKGKPNVKKQQAIQEKFHTLMKNLNPIPFIPTRILDFANHEKLLRNLGLWNFVHIDFDRSIRVDLVAQLIASYNPKQRASYVNDHRYKVNRADLARAFKLPLKKEKGNVGGSELDMDIEELSDDSIGFIVDVLSQWMLLHEDIWVMPDEVMDWIRMIKEGHPEKVDWAGLLWLMVEKELKHGSQLTDCYYASHLQHLMKCQRDDLFLEVKSDPEEEEVDGEAKEKGGEEVTEEHAKVVGAIESPIEEGPSLKGPSTELTLGQDGENEEGLKDVEMVDGEKWKDSDEEESGGEEQAQWLLKGKNDEGEHFMQPCGAENGDEFGSFEDSKYEEEAMEGEGDGEERREEDEEEAGDDFHVFPNENALEGDGFAGNLLQMGANQVAFSSQDQLRNPPSMEARVDMQHMGSAPSFFNSSGKRVVEHDNLPHHSLGDNNKRLRINEPWDNKQMDFGICLEQIQQMTERVRMLYAEKEQAIVESSMNQQVLLNEVQKRDAVIDHLHKTRMEEAQKKDREIYRLERELYLMGGVLDGYRKALKDVKKSFGEYKARVKLHEEPTYKDVGDGGLMLTGPELEKLRKKREEDNKMLCFLAEHKVKEVEEDLARQFHGYINSINFFDKRLIGLEAEAIELTEMYKKRKFPATEEQFAEGKLMEISEAPPNPEPEEKVLKLSVPQPSPGREEEVHEVSEPLPGPKSDEVAEVSKSPKIVEPEAKSPGVAEPPPFPQTEEEGLEVEEPIQKE